MRGRVVRIGDRGDPLVRPIQGGKIVLLTRYDELPEVGSIIDYEILRVGKNKVDIGYRVYPGTEMADASIEGIRSPSRLTEGKTIDSVVMAAPCNPASFDAYVSKVMDIYNTRFRQHQSEDSNEAFDANMVDLTTYHKNGDMASVKQMVDEALAWASEKTEYCEILKPGFAYFEMMHAFREFKDFLDKAA